MAVQQQDRRTATAVPYAQAYAVDVDTLQRESFEQRTAPSERLGPSEAPA
jgi:hypothetical protein